MAEIVLAETFSGFEANPHVQSEKASQIVRRVYVYFYVKRIAAVHTASQEFDISFYRYLMWVPTPQELAGIERDPDNYKPEWVPKLILLNQKSVTSEEPNMGGRKNIYHVLRQGAFFFGQKSKASANHNFPYPIILLNHFAGAPNVWGDTCDMPPNEPVLFAMAHEVMVTCSQRFDLHHFPFDVQSITMHYEADTNVNSMRIMPSCAGFGGDKPTVLFLEEAGELPEWIVGQPLVEFFKAGEYDQFAVMFKLQRRWQVYVWRVMFMIALISGISIALFAIDVKQLEARLSNLLTLLLTMVAFQFVISTNIPSLSYSTFLDKYIRVNFIFIAIICLESALFSYVDKLDAYDGNFAIAAISAWVAYHIALVLYVWLKIIPFQAKQLHLHFSHINAAKAVADFVVHAETVQFSEVDV